MRRARQTTPATVGVYVLVIVSLQLFLVMVALEAFITYEARLAWGAATVSVALGGLSALLYRFLRQAARPDERAPTRAVRREPR
jgi:hypothetical protein